MVLKMELFSLSPFQIIYCRFVETQLTCVCWFLTCRSTELITSGRFVCVWGGGLGIFYRQNYVICE